MSDRHPQRTSRPQLWLIRAIGVIVPRRLRAHWRREWEAELRHREAMLEEWDRLDWGAKLDLLWRSTSAFWDAIWLQPKRLEDEMFQDLRYGIRMMFKHKTSTLIAIVMLAFGIGGNTTIFSVLESVLFHPFALPHQDRLVMINESVLAGGVGRTGVTPGTLQDWREQSRLFEHFATANGESYELRGGERPEQVNGYKVSANYFAALGVQPLLGRAFQPGEDTAGREQIVVLKHSFWQRRFGADPNIIGRTITLGSKGHTVIGVMPADFNFPNSIGELWTPYVFPIERRHDRETHMYNVIALLKPGVTPEQGSAELGAFARRAKALYPAAYEGVGILIGDLNSTYTRSVQTYLPFLLIAVLFVLLIACANVAGLTLVRGAARQKELSVRQALGASQARIIRQLLTESVMLALLSGGLGVWLAHFGVTAIKQSLPQDASRSVPGWENIGLNTWALGFTLLISLLTGVLFGLMPALHATRASFTEMRKERGVIGNSCGALLDLVSYFFPRRIMLGLSTRIPKEPESGKGIVGMVSDQLRDRLVVAEIALSLVLLVGAGLVLQSFVKLLNTDLGFEPDNVISASIVLPNERYPAAEQRISFYRDMERRLAGSPDVAGVGLSGNLPGGWSVSPRLPIQIVGQPSVPTRSRPTVPAALATPGYFAAAGIPLRAGRVFSAQDDGKVPVALVNEAFARRFFPNGSALGERLYVDDQPPMEIVGIVGTVLDSRGNEPEQPGVYQPLTQHPRNALVLIVRGRPNPSGQADIANLVSVIRKELADLDPNLPLSDAKTLRETIRERVAPRRIITWLLGIFGLQALLMATVGLYAVLSFTVAERTHEIGIRLALGAQVRDVYALVVKQGLRLVSIGVSLGLVGAFVMSRVLSRILFGITATDPLTFLLVAVVLTATAFIACWIPARHAAKVDPLVALRHV